MHIENDSRGFDIQVKNPFKLFSNSYPPIDFVFDPQGDIWFQIKPIIDALNYDTNTYPLKNVLESHDVLGPLVSLPGIYKMALIQGGRPTIQFLQWLSCEAIPFIGRNFFKSASLDDIRERVDILAKENTRLIELITPLVKILSSRMQGMKL